jgi:hypothetical protein
VFCSPLSIRLSVCHEKKGQQTCENRDQNRDQNDFDRPFLGSLLFARAQTDPQAATAMSSTRARDEGEETLAPSPKRAKLDGPHGRDEDVAMLDAPEVTEKAAESLLPPSHALLNAPSPVYTDDGSMQRIMETDVGISEYIGHEVPRIEGIIKQR